MTRKPAKRRTKSAPKSTRLRGTAVRKDRAKKADAVETLVTAAGQALALPIDPSWRAGVTFNLQLLLKHAASIGDFPLPDDAEPAPVFRA
jgi:hypothetical protein